jgi:sugar-specific transcriptional regulator TrmB
MEPTETLAELGLTHNQARIYLALLHSDRLLTAKEISKVTSITRQDVYRILPELQNGGLIEKTITAPTMFKAISIKLAVSILVRKRVERDNDLIRKANQLAIELENEKQSTPEEEPEFILIPENEAVVQKINTLSASVQKSLDIVTSKKRFSRALFAFYEARMQSLQRGVKIRTISEMITSTNPDMDQIINIEKQAGVTIRYLPAQPPALLTLFDEEEVMIITSPNGTIETSALWSNNPSLIALSKSFFENLWQAGDEGKP